MIRRKTTIGFFCILNLVLLAFCSEAIANVPEPPFNVKRKAETDSIKGFIYDQSGKPMMHVSVENRTTKLTAVSSATGYFTIFGKKGDLLYIQHPGYYPFEKVWDGSARLILQLSARFLPSFGRALPTTDSLLDISDSYVEVLHGRQLKKNMVQSVGYVNNNQLMTTPAAQFLQALPGRIAGLNIGFSNGSPGLDNAGLSYNVRNARGANIILIDGVQRSYTSIDPDQIESVSVLRDALATAMFGLRSTNGIIAITTKKGNKGSPRLSFTAQSGFERPTSLPKPLSASQYSTLYNEAQRNDAAVGTSFTPRYSQSDIDAYNNGTDKFGHADIDWYSQVLKKQGHFDRYNFNVQGSGSTFRYFVDVDKLRETGLLSTIDTNTYDTNDILDRYIVRSNLGVNVTPTTFMQLNLFGRISKYNQPGGTVGTLFSSLASTPANAYPVFNPNGSLAGTSVFGANGNIYGQAFLKGYQYQDAKDISVDLQLKQKLDFLVPGLYAGVQSSYNNSIIYTTNRSKNFASFQYNQATNTYATIGSATTQGTAGTAGIRGRVTYVEAQLGYDGNFGKNHISGLLLGDQQSTLQFDSGNLPETYTDLAGRFSYNWDEKYLFEASGSYAGYNWFTPSKRWSPFGAVGIGWNLHREEFISRELKWLTTFKLRATYGLTGQANTGYYSYIQTYWNTISNIDNRDGYYFGQGAGLVRSTGQSALADNLGPEKAKKLNLGVDLGMLSDRLTISGEYFNNKLYDLVGLPQTRVTTLLGIGFPSENIQKFNYWGTDINIGWQDRVKNFNYFFSGNLSVVQSKVVFNDELPRKYDYQRTTGQQVGVLYGYTATGLFQSYAEINDPGFAILGSTPRSSLRPGDIRYLDRNGDGVINDEDRGPIGSGKPTAYFGLTFGFNFHGFDLSMLFQGSVNRQAALGGTTGQSGDFYNGFGNSGNGNAYEYNLGRWTPANPGEATQPRLWLGSNVNNQQVSTYWLKNTDFLRLKNLELGYTIPAKLTRKIGVPSVRFFSNGLNLITWSEVYKVRKDIDPESLGGGYPILRVINFGVSAKF